MKAKFKIGSVQVIIDSSRIEFDAEQAKFFRIAEDDEYTFDAISCAARQAESSLVNQLYKFDKQTVIDACNEANATKKIGVLSNGDTFLMLSPFVERYTFFGEEQAEKFTNDVIDQCISRNLHSLRITQFCMMRTEMPYFPQFKGILKALTEREDSTLNIVYFDIPEDQFYEMKTLFNSYEHPVKK
jgi:hypothetical protein